MYNENNVSFDLFIWMWLCPDCFCGLPCASKCFNHFWAETTLKKLQQELSLSIPYLGYSPKGSGGIHFVFPVILLNRCWMVCSAITLRGGDAQTQISNRPDTRPCLHPRPKLNITSALFSVNRQRSRPCLTLFSTFNRSVVFLLGTVAFIRVSQCKGECFCT